MLATELDGTSSVSATSAVKRKRGSLGDGSVELADDEESGIDMRNELKRLRREVEEKDRRLEELERIVG
ncbi:hypothetical protein NL341_28060, partial [Klebsiella pneumoniae]|nr:hypothetical protein [Klebsiella pneumoniae]